MISTPISTKTTASISQHAMQSQDAHPYKWSAAMTCTMQLQHPCVKVHNNVRASKSEVVLLHLTWCAVLSRNIHNYSVRPTIQTTSAFLQRETPAEGQMNTLVYLCMARISMADMQCMFLHCSTQSTNADKALLKDGCFECNHLQIIAVHTVQGFLQRMCVWVCFVCCQSAGKHVR